jgi:serine/threonine-protein kinase RsbW
VTTSSLDISARPELVRIARLMSVALARRGGLPAPLLDEVRVAVGEAVSRAVLINAGGDTDEPVRLTFTEDDRGYEVSVLDVGDAAAVPEVADDLPALEEDEIAEHGMPAGLDLALVAGMADEVDIGPHPAGGTLVRLRWTR